MNRNSSFAGLILDTIFKIVTFGFSGYLIFWLWLIISISLDNNNAESAKNIAESMPIFVFWIAVAILCVVGLVFTFLSFSLTKNEEKYQNKKKIFYTNIIIDILLFLMLALVAVFSVIKGDFQIYLFVLPCLFLLPLILYIVDIIKNRKEQKQE